MGKSSKPVIGYWYPLMLHFGFCRGRVDKLRQFRGGERTAWRGVSDTHQNITIDALNLWGGEKAEGGIQGTLEFMPGGPDQTVSGNLTAHIGEPQSAYRWCASAIYIGLYGAFNPYPKPASFLLERILEGWDNDDPWYPAKAVVPIPGTTSLTTDGYFFVAAGSGVNNAGTEAALWGTFESDFVGTADEIAQQCMLKRQEAGGGTYTFSQSYLSGTVGQYSIGGTSTELGPFVGIAGVRVTPVCPSGYATEIVQNGTPSVGITNPSVLCTQTNECNAMNPAHILYDSIVSQDMQGQPASLVDNASFMAAADQLFAEGFGLCTKYDPGAESVEDFRQRICTIIGASLSKSRIDGKYYLTLIRGTYDLASLPILTDDDILEYEEQPSDPIESVNQLTVEWFDPLRKEKRATAPQHALGAIQAAGGIIAETASYPEIPYEALADRVCARDLKQKSTPLKRFSLTTTRVPYAWRSGQFFRLQAPRRGIADMVCMVGEIDAGTPRSRSMELVAIQDVSGMPDTVYTEPQPGVDPTSFAPEPADAEVLLELPYWSLAGAMTAADLANVADDAGYLGTLAVRPNASALNYAIWSRALGEAFADSGVGQWCPSAIIPAQAGLDDPLHANFTLASGVDLSLVDVGSAALWGNDMATAEMVRVDALNTTTGAVSFGRGCGDATPRVHVAGERVWFFDGWTGTDSREYTDGEDVFAKLLTRTQAEQLLIALATQLSVTMSARAVRPYPPGRLLFNDAASSDLQYPANMAGAVTTRWAHRDRLLQADQVVDTTAVSVGPEAGTTYTVTYEQPPGVLLHTQSGISGTSAVPFSFPAGGTARIAVWAVRGGHASWQVLAHTFAYTAPPSDAFTSESGDHFITETGDQLVTG